MPWLGEVAAYQIVARADRDQPRPITRHLVAQTRRCRRIPTRREPGEQTRGFGSHTPRPKAPRRGASDESVGAGPGNRAPGSR